MAINQGELTSMAQCWRLERPDGAGIGLTSHDRRLIVDGLIHDPAPGMTPAAVVRSIGLDPHSGEVGGALSSDALDPDDLAFGRWNGSAVSLRTVDWNDPDGEELVLLRGELGEVSIDGDEFAAELKGAAARLDDPVCPATSAECRAQFGDQKCRVDLAGRILVAKVVSASDDELLIDQPVDERFLFGRLRYLDGPTGGATSVVLAVDGDRIRPRDRARAAVSAGERIELREGCDKAFETCCARFDNAKNFRGEPHLPGGDLLTRYPGA